MDTSAKRQTIAGLSATVFIAKKARKRLDFFEQGAYIIRRIEASLQSALTG